METAALLLTLWVLILVGLYLYAPFLERKSRRTTAEDNELSALLAERDRVVTSLQELDFDYKLGKIPAEDYPVQRAWLLQKGADTLKQIDSLTQQSASTLDTEARLEKAVAARRADSPSRRSRASMIRHSRTMPLSRSAGAVGGGIRIAQCRSPRRSS